VISRPRLHSIASLAALLVAGTPTAFAVSGPTEHFSAAAALDLTGTYVGTLSGTAAGTGFEARITADLIQAANRIIGSWSISGSSGTVTGTITGSALILEIRSTRPCASILQGSGVIEDGGAVLHGSYEGAGCQGWVKAVFRVNRELYVRSGPQWTRDRGSWKRAAA
jgi:hypothetical protein